MRYLLCFCLGITSVQSAFSADQVSANDETPADKRWALSSGSNQSRLNDVIATERFISLRYYSEKGSVSVEELHLRRGGSQDSALAVDAYPRLWNGAYANVRYQASDQANLYPHALWRAEVFQNLTGGWEISTAYDRLNFESSVIIKSVGIGHYWGNFYGRLRHQTVATSSSDGRGDRMMIRHYYLGDADNYYEVNFSKGQSIEPAMYALSAIHSNSTGLAYQYSMTRNWGFKISASRATDSSPQKNQEASASISATYRWP